jgi:hypothetical protein
MGDESTQDDRGITADEPTIDTNMTVGDENLTIAHDVTNQDVQIVSSPVDGQHAIGNASSPTRRRKLPHIILYAAFLLIGIILGAVGLLLFQLSIGGTRAPFPVTSTSGASGDCYYSSASRQRSNYRLTS